MRFLIELALGVLLAAMVIVLMAVGWAAVWS